MRGIVTGECRSGTTRTGRGILHPSPGDARRRGPVASEPDETVAAIDVYGPANRLADDVLHGESSERTPQVANVIQVSLTDS